MPGGASKTARRLAYTGDADVDVELVDGEGVPEQVRVVDHDTDLARLDGDALAARTWRPSC